MINHMKKINSNDRILIVCIFVAALLGSFLLFFLIPEQGMYVRVSVDGETVSEYDLQVERTVTLTGAAYFENTLVIKDGEADMIQAGCPDRICVRQRAISRPGESIVCLPNRIVVEVIGETGNEVDAVAD